jgi:hypothetical protein
VTTQDKATAIYARSGTHSRTGYRSLIAQQEVCRSYAEARGWRVGKVFSDVGTWGTQRYRWRMTQLLDAVRAGTVERVLIATPDDLAAVQADRTAILHILAEWDVPCVSVQQPMCRPVSQPAESMARRYHRRSEGPAGRRAWMVVEETDEAPTPTVLVHDIPWQTADALIRHLHGEAGLEVWGTVRYYLGLGWSPLDAAHEGIDLGLMATGRYRGTPQYGPFSAHKRRPGRGTRAASTSPSPA